MFFENTIVATGHTPLVELRHITPNPNVRILAKLEGQNLGGSFSIKDRIARSMIEKAEAEGKLTKEKVILEATSGNTGLALSILGRHKGYRVTIVMPESMSMERRRLFKIYGANLILTDGKKGMEGAIDVAREMVAKDNRYFMPDQFNNPANPQAHYDTTGTEIIEDFPYDKIDAFVVALGTGGTLTGVGRRLKEKYPDMEIVSVEPYANDPIMGLRLMSLGFIPPVIDMSLITQQTNVTSQQAAEMAAELVAKEGIFVGFSAGAAAYRAVEVARQMKEGNIVTVLPDGGWKYMSLNFWNK